MLGTTRIRLALAETEARPLPAAAETALDALLAATATARRPAPGHAPPPAPTALAPALLGTLQYIISQTVGDAAYPSTIL